MINSNELTNEQVLNFNGHFASEFQKVESCIRFKCLLEFSLPSSFSFSLFLLTELPVLLIRQLCETELVEVAQRVEKEEEEARDDLHRELSI